MKTVCETNQCTGCNACVLICPKKAVSLQHETEVHKAVIDESLCINCHLCERVCQIQNPVVERYRPVKVCEGYHADDDLYKKASSGGFATGVCRAFCAAGGWVVGVRFDAGKFVYDLTSDAEDVKQFAGSRYVRSEPGDIYQKVARLLEENARVLYIGVPCHVAGLKQFLGGDHDNLYTIDLICHGMPNQTLLSDFLREEGYSDGITDIQFRQKKNFGLTVSGRALRPRGVMDEYSIAFLNGICYTENCYACRYANMDRVADVTIGDSWGTKSTWRKSLSLLLVSTAKGQELLSMMGADFVYADCDLANAVAHNHQLEHPTIKPVRRNEFLDLYRCRGFKKAVKKIFRGKMFKQKIKSVLIKLKLLRR